MSGRNAEAENRRRRTTRAPDVTPGSRLARRALPWKSGIAQYRTSSGVKATADADAVEQPHLTLLGNDQLAVGMANVAFELCAPAGGVDPDDHRSGEGRAAQEEHVLGHVFEQHADMPGADGSEHRGPGRRLCEDPIPGPGT